MYTRRRRPKTNLPQPDNEPTLLGSAVGAAVHGRTWVLLQLLVHYFNWDRTNDLSDIARRLLRALGEIQTPEEPTDQENRIIQRASEELRKGHRQFRAALTWLCSKKEPAPSKAPSLKLLTSGRWEPGRYPDIDAKNEKFVRFFETHGLRHYRTRLSLQEGRLLPLPRLTHFVDLFCACILDRCLGRKPPEMPLKVCPQCLKLFLSERKQFCSNRCQWSHYWTPERRADDKWVKDLEKFSRICKPTFGRSITDLQNRLASPKVTDRVRSIKKKAGTDHWAGWQKIIQRLEEVERLAAKSNG
jgi:hypothetical protein